MEQKENRLLLVSLCLLITCYLMFVSWSAIDTFTFHASFSFIHVIVMTNALLLSIWAWQKIYLIARAETFTYRAKQLKQLIFVVLFSASFQSGLWMWNRAFTETRDTTQGDTALSVFLAIGVCLGLGSGRLIDWFYNDIKSLLNIPLAHWNKLRIISGLELLETLSRTSDWWYFRDLSAASDQPLNKLYTGFILNYLKESGLITSNTQTKKERSFDKGWWKPFLLRYKITEKGLAELKKYRKDEKANQNT